MRKTRLPETPPRLVQDILVERSNTAPSAEAVVDGPVRIVNLDLQTRVDAIARGLLASGVRRGDFVATLAPPSADFWLIFLATASIGAIWQGLNPRYQRNEYRYLLDDAAPKLVFARTEFDGRLYLDELKELAPVGTTFVPLDNAPLDEDSPFCTAGAFIADADLARARAAVEAEDPAVIVYTSGTTGKPKGALLSQRAIVETALANVAWIGRERLASTICPAPINHVGALNNVCMNTFAGGGRIVFFPRVDLAALGALNARELPSYLVASPTAFAMMLAVPGADMSRYSFYEAIIFGGAATPIAYLQEVVKTGAQLSSVYGQTETTGMVTYTPFGSSLEAMSETIGQALAGNQVRIGNDSGVEAELGETGEIQIKGVSVMSGYHNKPDATREAFTPDGWLKTGDLGFVREDGNIVFAGRLKEMFKSGGYNVYPVEVELAICEHEDVAQAVVVAVPHPTFQEVGHGFLLPKPGRTVQPDDVRAFLRERIADYKVPKTWQVLDVFPFLPNGKVDKRTLAARLVQHSS
ncbi:MAG: acyl--CoA ligase [Hyphomonadaceae bacterium JAD_PAG50586_4]|nr:MAG: acyl--CoA ligase [Hyphomonadaceae bacterium JAD_PAG50586_4]